MSGKNTEPKRLREGKAFHKKVQADWKADAQWDVRTEMTVSKDGCGRSRLRSQPTTGTPRHAQTRQGFG